MVKIFSFGGCGGGGGGHIVISALSPPLLSQRCDRFRCHNTVSVHIGV